MDSHEFLRSRRSIRRFKPDRVPTTVIERILKTATFAPSAHNRQPWRFVVLAEPSTKSQLADAMAVEFRRDLEAGDLSAAAVEAAVDSSRGRINAAPLVILLCMDISEMDVYPDSRRNEGERMMAIQSTANAGLQLLLAAHAEGLGGAWHCAPLFAPGSVKAALALPTAWEPAAMLLLGYPDENPITRKRKSIQEITIFK